MPGTAQCIVALIIDKQKEDVVVELLEAAVPIPITVKMDAVKVIRRETDEEEGEEEKKEEEFVMPGIKIKVRKKKEE